MAGGPNSINPAAQGIDQNLVAFGPSLPPSKYANAYSSSGFDMLGVLVSLLNLVINSH